MSCKFLIKFFLIFVFYNLFKLTVILLSEKLIPYLGFFPYKEKLINYNLPGFLTKMANFDGVHYLLISENGYTQYQQAFFPFYPILIKIFTLITRNSLISGLTISNLFFFIGLIIFLNYLKLVFFRLNKLTLIFMILLFPASFYFTSVYNEGLFFFLFSGTLYFLKKEKYLTAGIFSFFASLTRFIGIFFIIFFVFTYLKQFKKSKINFKLILAFLLPLAGLLSYCFYLWKTTGDPFMFFNSQPAFGANRSTHIILLPQVIWRYIKIIFTSSFNLQYFVSFVELTIFIFVFVLLFLDLKNLIFIKKLKKEDFDKISLNIFSMINLIIPTLTGTFSSIPRYALLSVSFLIYLSFMKNQLIKIFILIIFLIFQIIFLSFFVQGYFIA